MSVFQNMVEAAQENDVCAKKGAKTMPENLLVSVIVPIYNVEKYVSRCVNSLIKQDYNNIEIILIDDGSSDGSSAMLDEMAGQDARIHVFHQENRGVSAARNVGIKRAHGEFIMFVDGDDWVDSNYVSYFLDLVLRNNTTIGMDVNYHSASGGTESIRDEVIDAETAMRWIYSDKIFVAVWNKIYDRRLFNDYGIQRF